MYACRLNLTIFFISFSLISGKNFAQTEGLPQQLKNKIEQERLVRIMFYNVENLFDTEDDSLKMDEEFLPDEIRNWSKYRYYQKQNQLSKVITAVGGWSPPELVGLCEIENRNVLNYLTRQSSLYVFGYQIIHQESPDARGIDVALLYQPKSFRPVSTEFLAIDYPLNKRKTRDILYAQGILPNHDTLHVFVNHWPSRYGGQLESEENRIYVAGRLKQKTDSVLQNNPQALIVIMGDFNDEPNNTSLLKTLKALPAYDSLQTKQLINLSYELRYTKNQGSHKYQGQWTLLDQVIVSGGLLSKSKKTYTTSDKLTIFRAPFLLEPDEAYLGDKPFRTYVGLKYNGGFSDHLPVFIDLLTKE
ncbi:MAG: endonuclease [Bacteroidetes bacterium HGW-Bacteroidetes-4]|jgi:endonuclease/exonuclease/phosphatase family metal-dependent hydrolase|nr:MAG: endonuclease [Bacteroidetes bacterium HGW-Bacteroidetes-4]